MELSKAHIYFMYAHDYNTGYVGKTNNIKNRYCSHCTQGQLNKFANETNTAVKCIFEIHHIYTCCSKNAPEHEARVYWLIKNNFPQIKLLNKNIPNRKAIEWQRENQEKRQVMQNKIFKEYRKTASLSTHLLFTK